MALLEQNMWPVQARAPYADPGTDPDAALAMRLQAEFDNGGAARPRRAAAWAANQRLASVRHLPSSSHPLTLSSHG